MNKTWIHEYVQIKLYGEKNIYQNLYNPLNKT